MSFLKRTADDDKFYAYREAGNTGPWNWDAAAPADETNTPADQLAILADLAKKTPKKRH